MFDKNKLGLWLLGICCGIPIGIALNTTGMVFTGLVTVGIVILAEVLLLE